MARELHPVASDPLAEWMERYGPDLRRHLTGMLGGEDDAEDVLQQVWVSAYRRPPETGAGSNVRAWLYRVATNAALDRLARDRRRRAALHGRRPELAADDPPPPDAGVLVLEERARRRIREHTAQLPRKQREAVWLRWVEGDDYTVIARKLGCTEESARANVYNGMKRLRKELFDLWKEEYAQ
jgi:RNA polymerase sigma-70 factor (ECF subfamily)